MTAAAEAARHRLIALWAAPEAVSLWWGHGGADLRSVAALRLAMGGTGTKVLWGAAPLLARLRALGVEVPGRVDDLQLLTELLAWRYRLDCKPAGAQEAWSRWRRYFASMSDRPTERQLYLDLAELRARMRPELPFGAELRIPDFDIRLLSLYASASGLLSEPPHLVRAVAFDLGAEWLRCECARRGCAEMGAEERAEALQGLTGRHPTLREWAEQVRGVARRRGTLETRHGRRLRVVDARRPQLCLIRAEHRDSVQLLALRLARSLEERKIGFVRDATRDRVSLACAAVDAAVVLGLGAEMLDALPWGEP